MTDDGGGSNKTEGIEQLIEMTDGFFEVQGSRYGDTLDIPRA
jgi:hypothetical protein